MAGMMLAFVSCAMVSQGIGSEGIRLVVELDNTVFVEGESIYAVVTLHNDRLQDLEYDGYYLEAGKLTMDIRQANGTRLPYRGAKFAIVDPFRFVLGPQERVSLAILVDGYFPTQMDEQQIYRKMSPGEYSLKADFLLGESKVQSSTLSFRVIPATGKNREALQEMERLLVPSNYFSSDTAAVLEVFHDFIRKFGETKVASRVWREIAWTYRKAKDSIRALQTYENILQRFPNHGLSLDVLQSKYIPESRKALMIEEVSRMFPSSLVAKYARVMQARKHPKQR
jgi:hypothetical protein